jgi:hypothetical protein
LALENENEWTNVAIRLTTDDDIQSPVNDIGAGTTTTAACNVLRTALRLNKSGAVAYRGIGISKTAICVSWSNNN